MKRIVTILAAVIFTANVFAQAPSKMSYQAVVRNTGNVLVTVSPVGMRISVLQGSPTGTAVYVETQTPTTNDNGLVSIEIGSGNVVSGDFSAINWASGPYYIKTESDPTGGTNYTIVGTNQLMSVPYALYAETSGTPGPQGPPGNDGLIISGTDPGNTPYWDGSQWMTGSSNIYNNGGNVGIGTSNPSQKLEVAGVLKLGEINSQEGGELHFRTGSMAGGGNFVMDAYYSAPGGNKFRIANDSTGKTPVTIMDNGNVGIGNWPWDWQPNYTLDVLGDGHVSGTVNVGSDFSGAGRVNIMSNNNTFSDPIGVQLKVSSYVKSWDGAPNITIPLYSVADIDASYLSGGNGVTFTDAAALHLTAPYGSDFTNGWALMTDGSVKVNGSVTTSGATVSNTFVGDGSLLTNVAITDNSVTSAKIADDVIVDSDISSSAAIAYSKLNLTDAISTGDITTDAVTTAKIADGAVTSAKIESSPAFAGTPTAPTPTAGDNSTNIATTEFVTAAVRSNEMKAVVSADNMGALDSSYAGKIITTQWGQMPVFPEDLPDGFTCTIVMYSNYQYTSNTLTTAMFFNTITGWNGGVGSSAFGMPSGGTVKVTVATIGTQKCYFLSGDVN